MSWSASIANIQFHKFKKGESCSEEGCPSRKWFTEDGKRYCHNGHEQAGITERAQDEDDWQQLGKTTNRKREKIEKVKLKWTGRKASDLYLSCYQLVLRKQCWWLVTVKGFPAELEGVVRDLWELRVRSLGDEEEDRGFASTPGLSTSEEETDDSGGESSRSRSGRWSRSSRWSRRSKRDEKRLPKLIETLGLLYLGCVLMRLPVSLGEVWKWAVEDGMVYTRAITEIPPEMRRHLPGHFHAALEIHKPLKGASIYKAVLELVEFFHTQFKIHIPPLNFPLILYKHVRLLALPIEIYAAVRRLATILNIEFTYPVLHKRNYSVLTRPEVSIMALIVIATKISQPFDDIQRVPESYACASALKVDWRMWRQTMTEKPIKGLRPGKEIEVKDVDVLKMGEQEMDDYLDWYQRSFVGDDEGKKMPKAILEQFPLQELPPLPPKDQKHEEEEVTRRLKEVQKNLVVVEPVESSSNEKGKIVRPGELYSRYRTVDELPENAKAFFEIAAKNVGISVSDLVRGVFQMEVKLDTWRIEQKRKLVEMMDRMDMAEGQDSEDSE